MRDANIINAINLCQIVIFTNIRFFPVMLIHHSIKKSLLRVHSPAESYISCILQFLNLSAIPFSSTPHTRAHTYMYVHLCSLDIYWAPPRSSGSALDHKSLLSKFKSRLGRIWTVFHIWLRFITFGSRSAHLAYPVHKSGRKTPIITWILLIFLANSFLFLFCIPHSSIIARLVSWFVGFC